MPTGAVATPSFAPVSFKATNEPVGPISKLLALSTLLLEISPNNPLMASANCASTFAAVSPVLFSTTEGLIVADAYCVLEVAISTIAVADMGIPAGIKGKRITSAIGGLVL